MEFSFLNNSFKREPILKSIMENNEIECNEGIEKDADKKTDENIKQNIKEELINNSIKNTAIFSSTNKNLIESSNIIMVSE